MDHIRILKRAFHITRLYRALWIFGVLLALTTARGSGSGDGGGGSGVQYTLGRGEFPFYWNFPGYSPVSPAFWNAVAGLIIAVTCFIFLLVVLFTIVHYVSNTALIRMVDRYEASEQKVSVGEGFRLGWSRGAFRTWLVDLIIGVAGVVIAILLLVTGAAPLLLWLTHDNTAGIIGTVITIGLEILVILLLVVAVAVVTIVVHLIQRAIVLENLGVFDGIRRGWLAFRRRMADNIIMGLIMFGIRLGWSILMIPVFILLVLAGLVIGGLPALLIWAIFNAFAQGSQTPGILAAIVGVPLFLIVLIGPFLFLGGLFETFRSATWTLTYRELLALGTVQPPAPIAPVSPAAPAAPAIPAEAAAAPESPAPGEPAAPEDQPPEGDLSA